MSKKQMGVEVAGVFLPGSIATIHESWGGTYDPAQLGRILGEGEVDKTGTVRFEGLTELEGVKEGTSLVVAGLGMVGSDGGNQRLGVNCRVKSLPEPGATQEKLAKTAPPEELGSQRMVQGARTTASAKPLAVPGPQPRTVPRERMGNTGNIVNWASRENPVDDTSEERERLERAELANATGPEPSDVRQHEGPTQGEQEREAAQEELKDAREKAQRRSSKK